MDTMIQIEHLRKMYYLYDKPIDRLKEVLHLGKKLYHREFYALKDISLSIKRGESVGIVGVNGSGKSTLLKLIAGVLNPTEGTVETYGKVAALLELGAGFNPEYTGRENIYLNGTMMGYSEAEMEQRVQPIIRFADIGDFIDQPVKTYSSGMFARLAFAVAINVSPDILIVDEALAVGDTRFQVKCINKMKELKERGTTILFVSHATEQIKRFCTRAIWIREGCVYEDGEASQVVDLYDNFMRYGSGNGLTDSDISDGEEKAIERERKNILAAIDSVTVTEDVIHTFDELQVNVEYEILEENIEGFLLGVAIYSKDRSEYIFGPNTSLDQFEISGKKGRYRGEYRIPKLPLIKGEYVIDVGLFNNEGLVNLDYKMSAARFVVSNSYFSEGMVYMEHLWNIQEIDKKEWS
ncbi:MAG: ABC transporter ATP-binding protein [Clostridiaceae bacterium]|nr:ABC transporter ATP-binding protein [Clostridiaceae bacterium]